jgi:hypothetical protein
MSEASQKVSFSKADAVIPLPEALTAFRSDTESGERVPWDIEETLIAEETSVSFKDRKFKTTVLRDEASRFFRNRENIRVLAGINNPEVFDAVAKEFPKGLLKSAEDLRMNAIAKKAKFDLDYLKNGSEVTIGERLAEDGTGYAWNILVMYGIPLVGSKAFNSLLTGVRRQNPDWASVLRDMSNELLAVVNARTRYQLIDTDPYSYKTTPEGEIVKITYGALVSLDIARTASNYLLSESEIGYGPGSGEEDEEGVSLGFAQLIIDETVRLTKTVQKSLLRKYKSDVFGTDIRYPERLLTDPHRRIFGRKKPIDGGIVLIDVSGSMALEEGDIKAILDAAPGALVMAYSHRRGTKATPNLFILADRGKQVEDLSTVNYNNVGNGVDGPALMYAVKRRLRKEPIIWVCDGHVTNSDDRSEPELSMHCARLVVKYDITTAYKVEDAISMLRTKKYVSVPTRLDPYIREVKKERKGF